MAIFYLADNLVTINSPIKVVAVHGYQMRYVNKNNICWILSIGYINSLVDILSQSSLRNDRRGSNLFYIHSNPNYYKAFRELLYNKFEEFEIDTKNNTIGGVIYDYRN